RDDVEFGMILEERLAIGIGPRRVELTKILAEGDQLRIGEFLFVEDDGQPLAPYVLNSLDLFWRDGLRQIQPGNFCAQRRVEVFDRKRHDYSSVETTSLRILNLSHLPPKPSKPEFVDLFRSASCVLSGQYR